MAEAAALRSQSRFIAGALSVLAGGLCWSFTGVFIRLAPHLDAWQFLIYRGLGVALAFALIARSKGRGAILADFLALGPLGVVAALALSMAAIGFIVALKLTSVANALFLSSCAPLLSAILGFLILGERLGVAADRRDGARLLRSRRSSSAAASRPAISPATPGGSLCALSFAVVSVCMRLAPERDFGPAMVGYGVFSALVAASVALAEGATLAPPLMEALCGFAAGFVLMGLGFALFLRGAPIGAGGRPDPAGPDRDDFRPRLGLAGVRRDAGDDDARRRSGDLRRRRRHGFVGRRRPRAQRFQLRPLAAQANQICSARPSARSAAS